MIFLDTCMQSHYIWSALHLAFCTSVRLSKQLQSLLHCAIASGSGFSVGPIRAKAWLLTVDRKAWTPVQAHQTTVYDTNLLSHCFRYFWSGFPLLVSAVPFPTVELRIIVAGLLQVREFWKVRKCQGKPKRFSQFLINWSWS